MPTLLTLTAADAGEVLTLQRAAYVSEAQLYADPRLTVVPDLQGRGLGSRLLEVAEDVAGCRWAVLFTGHLSARDGGRRAEFHV